MRNDLMKSYRKGEIPMKLEERISMAKNIALSEMTRQVLFSDKIERMENR
jgi:hypothetical protein